ncbi:MAG: helix-turn-helix domain-containing protein [Candidatus Dormibacteraeota bacterium]|nr:helix-turn-helix domain-containing protein [Candidatus Dormibacteraeota bacterium]
MIRQGELPVLRIGRLVRIPRSELDKWITERLEAPRAAA